MKRSFKALAVTVLLLFSATSVANAEEYSYLIEAAQCYSGPDFSALDPNGVNTVLPAETEVEIQYFEGSWAFVYAFPLEGIIGPDESYMSYLSCYVEKGKIDTFELPEDSGNANEGGEQVITETPAPADVPQDDCVTGTDELCPGMGSSEPKDKGVYPVIGENIVNSDGTRCRVAPSENSDVRAVLMQGQSVTELADDKQDGWQYVVFAQNGENIDCYVWYKLLGVQASEPALEEEPVEAIAPPTTSTDNSQEITALPSTGSGPQGLTKQSDNGPQELAKQSGLTLLLAIGIVAVPVTAIITGACMARYLEYKD